MPGMVNETPNAMKGADWRKAIEVLREEKAPESVVKDAEETARLYELAERLGVPAESALARFERCRQLASDFRVELQPAAGDVIKVTWRCSIARADLCAATLARAAGEKDESLHFAGRIDWPPFSSAAVKDFQEMYGLLLLQAWQSLARHRGLTIPTEGLESSDG